MARARSSFDSFETHLVTEPGLQTCTFLLLLTMAKILIIDDERFIRSSLREILEYEKYEVIEAQDGAEGLQKIKDEEIDLVLCDVKMPILDGMDVLDQVRQLDRSPQFIMISAHGTIETAVEATKKGAFDFISKPPDLNRLLLTVRNALDKK